VTSMGLTRSANATPRSSSPIHIYCCTIRRFIITGSHSARLPGLPGVASRKRKSWSRPSKPRPRTSRTACDSFTRHMPSGTHAACSGWLSTCLPAIWPVRRVVQLLCWLPAKATPGDPISDLIERSETGLIHSGADRLVFQVYVRCIRWPGAELGLANVEPGDRAADQHPLDFARGLEDREDPVRRGSFRRSAACMRPWYQHRFSTPCPR
jgi:hypothetical protein